MNIKTILTVLIIIILLFFVRSIGLSIYTQIDNEGTVNELKEQLAAKKREKVFLTQRLTEVETDTFVEKEAREKLGLTRENEYRVFTSPPNSLQNNEKIYSQPNWKKWGEVFRL
jgi:cell division protein FtsB